MNIFTKLLKVPVSNYRKEIAVAQTWEVRWKSFRQKYPNERYPGDNLEMEVFLTEQDADNFAQSLHNAFDLLRYIGEGTDGNICKILITKRK